MVDAARQMLDELMGRNRNIHPSVQVKQVNWDDPEFCQYYLVKFCPHDLFVNTRADLGPCPRIHDDEAKKMYDGARNGARKRQFEDEFLRFCNNMISEVDRKIQKGKQRLLLMNKVDRDGTPQQPQVYVSKFQDQINNLNARIKKLLNEAEEAGHRGDVDQAQGLMTLCDQLKDEKTALLAQHEGNSTDPSAVNAPATDSNAESQPGSAPAKIPPWMSDLTTTTEKQMEVCEICGAFLIVGDAQQRIEDHLMGKQHLGYSKLRKAVDELHEKRNKDREEEEKRREGERRYNRMDNNFEKNRDRRDFRSRDFDDGKVSSNHRPDIERREHNRRGKSRHENKAHRRSRSRSNHRSRSSSYNKSHSRK